MKKQGILIWFILIVVLSVVFVIPSAVSRSSTGFIREISRPISRPLVTFGYNTHDFFSMIFEIGNLRRENQRLANDLVASHVDESKMLELTKENEDLKTQLAYKNAHPEMKMVLADVIGLDPTNYSATLVIDRGSDDGIAVGQAVISLGVLVGKIDQVSKNNSRVILITSKDSIVQVMLQNSRTIGVLSGGIAGMKLGSVPLDTAIAPSENIITSGLGGKLPKGIYVGTAGSEVSVKSEIFKTIEVISPVNFSKLEYLFIVTGV
ncbi:MAG: rod shape-determining protein MreC [Candidatus Berkelbacteria bacterium]|nr:rod shape-determining protein MreC [Candidatus Berkelbacteria bacterium]